MRPLGRFFMLVLHWFVRVDQKRFQSGKEATHVPTAGVTDDGSMQVGIATIIREDGRLDVLG